MADYASDFYVMLQYACVVENSLTPDCSLAIPGNQTSREPLAAECIPQWSWFGISCALVVLSTLVPSFWWMAFQTQREGQSVPRMCAFCCLGIFQLTHLWELATFARRGTREEHEKDASSGRTLFAAVVESVPQLYLQAYVLFALGARGQAFKLASVCLSVTTLTASVVMLGTTGRNDRLSTWKAQAAAALFIGTDAAVRSMGLSMAFSEPVRPYGAPVAAATFVACVLYQAWSIPRGAGGVCNNLASLPYVVPAAAVIADEEEARRKHGMPVVLGLRFLETVAFGILAAAFGEAACGGGLETELAVYFGMLVANALSLITFKCFSDGSGAFTTSMENAVTLGQ
ncbi:unnamed protein product, partial [Symbiodinium natans]